MYNITVVRATSSSDVVLYMLWLALSKPDVISAV